MDTKTKLPIGILSLTLVLSLALVGCGSVAPASDGKSQTGSNEATSFPNKSITILVNTSPGSSVDVMARTVAKVAQKYLGQTLVVENKPGGDGAIAMSALINGKTDGYTLWAGTKTLPVALNTNMKQFKLDQFQPVIRIQDDPFALGVNKYSPFNNLTDLIKYAKAHPKEVKIGGFGAQSAHTIATYDFMDKAGIEMTWVPFNSGGDGITAVLGGHIDVSQSNPSSFNQFLKSGELKMLGVAANSPIADYPGVKTYKEQGIDIVDSQWRGLFVKGGTPDEIVQKLHDALKKAIYDPEFVDYMKKSSQLDGYQGPKEFKDSIQKEFEITKKLVEKVGLGK